MNTAIVHHSVSPRDQTADKTERSFNRTHKERHFPKSSLGWYIGYHYVIFGTGEIRQYRKNNEMGAHTKGMNHTIGICCVGNFDVEYPSEAQEASLRRLMKKLNIRVAYPHRKFSRKTCYGKNLDDNWADNMLKLDMTREVVINLYRLSFYREPTAKELTYWTGKDVSNFLIQAIADRAKFLSL